MEIPNFAPEGNSNVKYASPGHLLFSRDRTLLAQPFDAERQTVTGEPITVAENVGAAFSASDNGTLVYRHSTVAPSVAGAGKLLWLNRLGKPAGEVSTPTPPGSIELSRDGRQIVMDTNRQRQSDVWVINDRGVPQKLTTDPGFEGFPIWNPMGSQVSYAATTPGKPSSLYLKASNGVGREELLLASDNPEVVLFARDWSSDGRYFVFDKFFLTGTTTTDIWILPLSGEKKPVAFLATPARETQGQVSPDGQFIAYVTNESGTDQIVVRTFPDPNKGQWQITSGGGVEPRWRRKDGRELYYLSPEGKVMAVAIANGSTFLPGAPTELFQAPALFVQAGPFQRRYDVSADGQRFLFAAIFAPTSDSPASTPITAVINWTHGLKKK